MQHQNMPQKFITSLSESHNQEKAIKAILDDSTKKHFNTILNPKTICFVQFLMFHQMSTIWLNVSRVTCELTLRIDENDITMSKRR